MYKSVLINFNKELNKILEGFNVYPKSRSVNGLQPPVPSTNVNSVGPIPTGFKGSGPAGIAPSNMSTVLVKFPKKKKKKKIKKI
jgi:hypothetical protein